MLSLLLTAGIILETPQIQAGEAVDPSTYRVEVLAEDLDHPWNLSWLPNGDMLVTERGGRLRVVRDGQLLETPVAGMPAVHSASQAGLFEAVLHPDFADNGWLYLTFARGDGDRNTLALARGRYTSTAQGGALTDVEILFEADAWRGTSAHYGGRMVWMDDGTLLLTSGDGYRAKDDAPRSTNHFGKILRLTEDGEPAAGNPMADDGGAAAAIWSQGHRNPQGIAIAPDGTVYANEHGPRGGDELNIIEPGTNYGWPLITYGIDYSGAEISPYSELPGLAQPLWHWTPSIAPSSLIVYDGTDFPQWQGMVMVGALAHTHVRIADPTTPEAPQLEILRERGERIRDIAVGPDGALYVTTEIRRENSGGQVWRILPER